MNLKIFCRLPCSHWSHKKDFYWVLDRKAKGFLLIMFLC